MSFKVKTKHFTHPRLRKFEILQNNKGCTAPRQKNASEQRHRLEENRLTQKLIREVGKFT